MLFHPIARARACVLILLRLSLIFAAPVLNSADETVSTLIQSEPSTFPSANTDSTHSQFATISSDLNDNEERDHSRVENTLLTRASAAYPRVEEVCMNAAFLYRFCITSFPDLQRDLGYPDVYSCFAEIDEMGPIDLPGARLQTVYFLLNGSTSTVLLPVSPIITYLIDHTAPLWTEQIKNAILYFSTFKFSLFHVVWRGLCTRQVSPWKSLAFGCIGSAITCTEITGKSPAWEPLKSMMRQRAFSNKLEKFNEVHALIHKGGTLPATKMLDALDDGANIHTLPMISNFTFSSEHERNNFIRQLIHRGMDVNFFTGHSYILWYTLEMDPTMNWARALLEYGWDVNSLPMQTYESHLMRAIEHKQTKLGHLLLTCGANPDGDSGDVIFASKEGSFHAQGVTPLMVTTSRSLAKRLIEKGANVNARDNQGLTPLFFTEKWNIAKMLIAHGANVSHRSVEGMNLLMTFVTNQVLLKRILDLNLIPVDSVDNNGRSALHYAFGVQGCVDSIRRLIKAGANVNLADIRGRTPVMVSRKDNDIHWKILRGAGLLPDLQDNLGNTALHHAVRQDSEHIIRVLRKLNASAVIRNAAGDTPLDIAIRKNKEAITFLLVDLFGVAVSASTSTVEADSSQNVSEQHQQNLQNAAESSSYTDIDLGAFKTVFPASMVDSLQSLRNKAVDQLRDAVANKADTNSLMSTIADMQKGVRAIFSSKNDDSDTLITDTAAGFHSLIEAGVDPDFVDSKGYSMLYMAMYLGFPEVSLQRGASKIVCAYQAMPDFQGPNGKTALMIASKHGYTGTVTKLLAEKASPDVQDKNGYTALMEAIANEREEVVSLLLYAGARRDLTNKFGWDAMTIATSGRGPKGPVKSRIIQQLLDYRHPN